MHSAVVGAERIDHGTMRTINLALLLGTLRSGPISRAELSRRTHLSKASITSLAAELAARGLVREGSPDRNGTCLLYTSPSPRDGLLSRMPSSA